MAKASKSAPVTKTRDEIIVDLQKLISEKKSKISKITNSTYLTNQSFKETTNSTSRNLNTVTDSNEIVEILAMLLQKANAHAEAATRLGVKASEFKHQGYTLNEWETDLKTRLNKISISSEKKKLADLEARLAALESPELKAQRELDDIMNALNEE
jgi:hypothetical protein